MGRDLVEIVIVVRECEWLMHMFRARLPLYICFRLENICIYDFGGWSTYVSVVLGPECICNLFRLEFLCNFGSEILYVDYWLGSQNCKMKLHL